MLFFLYTSFLIHGAFAQTCDVYYPYTSGTSIKVNNYDDKGKLTGYAVTSILDQTFADNILNLKVAGQTFSAKGKEEFKGNFDVRCENDVLYLDMKSLISPEQMKQFQNMEIQITQSYLEFPSKLNAGDVLKDGQLTMDVSSSGIPMMKMTMQIKNRVVEGFENLSTPAGSFECAKIKYDMETKMIVPINIQAVTWYAKNAGAVKTESYHKGKLIGWSEIAEIKK